MNLPFALTAIAAIVALVILVLATRPKEGGLTWTYGTGIACAVGAMVLVGMIFYLYNRIPDDKIMDLGAARQVIMFAMIVAVVGFGGALIILPFCLADDTDTKPGIADRFRLSREIFLVFSSIFATVVGFYFGGSGIASRAPGAIGIVPTLSSGVLSITISGGEPPYKAGIKYSDGTDADLAGTEGDGAVWTLKPDAHCPAGAMISVSGANGATYPAVPLNITREAFRNAGWDKACQDVPAGSIPAKGPASKAAPPSTPATNSAASGAASDAPSSPST